MFTCSYTFHERSGRLCHQGALWPGGHMVRDLPQHHGRIFSLLGPDALSVQTSLPNQSWAGLSLLVTIATQSQWAWPHAVRLLVFPLARWGRGVASVETLSHSRSAAKLVGAWLSHQMCPSGIGLAAQPGQMDRRGAQTLTSGRMLPLRFGFMGKGRTVFEAPPAAPRSDPWHLWNIPIELL